MKLQIRYLKQGLIEVEIEAVILDRMTGEDLMKYAEDEISKRSDEALVDGLSDHGPNGEFFIEDPAVEAVEEVNGDILVATRAWTIYSRDPNGGELAELDLEGN